MMCNERGRPSSAGAIGVILATFAVSLASALASQNTTAACREAPRAELNFLLGDWDVSAQIRDPGQEEWRPHPTWVMTRVPFDSQVPDGANSTPRPGA